MCTYGIGLPFDHPIWETLPPCGCGTIPRVGLYPWDAEVAERIRKALEDHLAGRSVSFQKVKGKRRKVRS
jgi:hypothetical protein